MDLQQQLFAIAFHALRQRPKSLEPVAQVADRLRVGEARDGPLSGFEPIIEGGFMQTGDAVVLPSGTGVALSPAMRPRTFARRTLTKRSASFSASGTGTSP